MSDEIDKKFISLFKGSNRGFYLWDNVAQNYLKVFKEGTPTDLDWKTHFIGKLGLVLVPIKEDGNCNFAAIDIDFYDSDRNKRQATEEELKLIITNANNHKLPLNFFFSKSGSVHCYVFFAGNGRIVSEVRTYLADWAKLLGYPTAEIFPKQNSLGEDGKGSGINIPYLQRNIRPALVYRNGRILPLRYEEFVNEVYIVKEDEKIKVDYDVDSDNPPCLDILLKKPADVPMRNNTLFNLAVLYRKQNVHDWEEKIRTYNHQKFDQPLTEPDIKQIIRSASKKGYEYLCTQPPICDICNKGICLKRKFGVGKHDGVDEKSYDVLIIQQLKKINTDPARYIVTVCGKEVECDAETLFSSSKFRLRVREKCDITPPPVKPMKWDLIVKDLQRKMIIVEPPKDASLQGQIEDELVKFLEKASKEIVDLVKGKPYFKDNVFYFKSKDFLRYLHATGIEHKLKGHNLYAMLHLRGINKRDLQLNGREIEVWYLSANTFNMNIENKPIPLAKENEPPF